MSFPALSQPSTKNPRLAALFSLIVPGAGQLYLGAREAGIAILVTTIVLALLIQFTSEVLRISVVETAIIKTSWLWLLLAVFWLWNVFDAHRRGHGLTASRAFGFAVPILIIYIIAWQVTDVNFTRLVTRFDDVKFIFNALLHPDFFTRDTEQQSGTVTIQVPCSPTVPPPPPEYSGLPVQLDRLCGTVGDPVTMTGQGFLANTSGNVYWLEYGGTNEVQVRSGGAPVVLTTDASGVFSSQFPIPTFAARDGLDPVNPVVQAVEARFVQEVGPPKPSENFTILIGSIQQVPAPQWMVNLGLAAPGSTVPRFVPGGIWVTIALGLMATFISIAVAAPLSFLGARNIMARVRGGTVIYYIARFVFNFVRSVDTLIWAIILVTWTGLGAFTGLIALSIHSIAAIAKLYSEEVEHIDEGPVEASIASGGSTLQSVRFAVIPQIIPPFLAYSLLRWDINMRSATVVGFVSAAGIGFYIFEAIRKGGYKEYAAALWAIAIVVMIVDFVSSAWRERILRGEQRVRTPSGFSRLFFFRKRQAAADTPPEETGVSQMPPKPFYRTRRGIIYTILFILIFIASWNLSQIDLSKLLEPAPTLGKVVSDYIAIDTSVDVWRAILRQILVTIFQALLATTLGAIVAIPVAFLAAKNITGRSPRTSWLYYASRFVLNFLRSIEAFLYVGIFVFWVGVGAFAGMLALAVTTFGLIGKLFSEAIENIEEGPVEALTATGANRLQTIMFAVLPQIVPPFISYSIYQWDINIRLATIIGFAGGGGIGLLFQNYVGQLQYHKAGAVILAIVVVVSLMDFASAKIRQRMV